MAISWDTNGCVPPQAVNDQEAKDRDTLIVMAGMIRAGDLTEDDQTEWFIRIKLLETFCGFKQRLFGEDDRLAAVLQRWSGMTTNVDDIPRHKWLHDQVVALAERAACDAEFALNRELVDAD